jgi:hypothetical protein
MVVRSSPDSLDATWIALFDDSRRAGVNRQVAFLKTRGQSQGCRSRLAVHEGDEPDLALDWDMEKYLALGWDWGKVS